MQASSTQALRLGALATLVAATLGLAACDKSGETTAGQRTDGVIADTKEAGSKAADAMKGGVMDATITTKINAALAADDKLSATKIDVDTAAGRVTLNGTAPDAASRDRATTLASAVEGVMSVDNRLAVKGS